MIAKYVTCECNTDYDYFRFRYMNTEFFMPLRYIQPMLFNSNDLLSEIRFQKVMLGKVNSTFKDDDVL